MLELRVSALLVLTAYLFSIDCYVLSSANISVPYAFGYHGFSRKPREVANWMMGSFVGGCLLVALQRLLAPSIETRIVPISTLCITIAIPLSQHRLFRVLKRVIIGRISAENRLGDILVSDTLVSMATVLVDIVYAFSLTFYSIPVSDPVNRPKHIGFGILIVACIPQGIRIKQCIIDYARTKNKMHLLNVLKYVVGNMPHALRANIAALNPDIIEEANTRLVLESWLRKSLLLNALYSLAWDILVDWQLLRLREPSRHTLRFPIWSYYSAAACDALLRFTFLFAVPVEHVIFSLQALELVRRGMWVIFRVESEPIELTHEVELSSLE